MYLRRRRMCMDGEGKEQMIPRERKPIEQAMHVHKTFYVRARRGNETINRGIMHVVFWRAREREGYAQ